MSAFSTLVRPEPLIKGGSTTIDGVALRTAKDTVGGMRSFHIGNDPLWGSFLQAASATYKQVHGPADYDVNDMTAKVTVLRAGEDFMGGAYVTVIEGRLFPSSRPGKVGFLPKGKRSQGYAIDPSEILAVRQGWGKTDVLSDSWFDIVNLLPAPTSLSADLLAVVPEFDEMSESNNAAVLAVITTHPGFDGGPVAGCVWFLFDKQTDPDDPSNTIYNGFMWAPPSELFSEHGATYASNLRGAAFIPPALTLSDCYNLPDNLSDVFSILTTTV